MKRRTQPFLLRVPAGQRGYILAMLLGLTLVMGIFLTRAMPSVVAEVQRGAEAELVFRGEAIAKGIRLYQQRTGGYPLKLEELLKVKPPVLRKLYKDPMTPNGEWDLITAVQPGPSGDKTGLPIVGVRSTSHGNSYRVYQGKSMYSEWAFSAADNLLGVPGGLQRPGMSPVPTTTPTPSNKPTETQ
ncbi:MAG: hypothetical protein LWX11_03920 [Firmicutes bacterium]|nr:hypothetical protein [Bacillota bacterium]